MSVGDVLRDADSGTMYQCDMVGWTKVENQKKKAIGNFGSKRTLPVRAKRRK